MCEFGKAGSKSPQQYSNSERGVSRNLWPIIRQVFPNEARALSSAPFPQLAGLPASDIAGLSLFLLKCTQGVCEWFVSRLDTITHIQLYPNLFLSLTPANAMQCPLLQTGCQH